MHDKHYECCILGAGPAGIGTALELIKNGVTDILLIDKNKMVGGLSRTETYGKYKFDIGPHRFFSKNNEINKLWHETLKSDFIPVKRLTRIYYKQNYFHYPIKPFDTLLKLGLVESTQAILSFANAKLNPDNDISTFENWIKQKFGNKLYKTFFKTYTEKVWGIPCNQIGAEFAEQRIKGLDIIEIIKNTYKKNKIKTLIDEFHYPILGAGQMYEVMAEKITNSGASITLESTISKLNIVDNKLVSIISNTPNRQMQIYAKQFFSSIPMTLLFKIINPLEKKNILNAANSLYYRDHITVNLIVDKKNIFPDQWIYIHDPKVTMARIANYNNFSSKMCVKNKTSISVEYFTFKDEKLWKMKNQDLINHAIDELNYIGLVNKHSIEHGWVVRETESYPTYYLGYKEPFNILKNRLNEIVNLIPIGRGGLYRYNNQDHATYSGIVAARNYLNITNQHHDVWNINVDSEYHEG